MTGIVHAVYMRISRLTALMALSYYLLSNAFPQALIKYKILSMKFIR